MIERVKNYSSLVEYLLAHQEEGEKLDNTARRLMVQEAMEDCGWNMCHAGEMLGMSGRMVRYWMNHFQIQK